MKTLTTGTVGLDPLIRLKEGLGNVINSDSCSIFNLIKSSENNILRYFHGIVIFEHRNIFHFCTLLFWESDNKGGGKV